MRFLRLLSSRRASPSERPASNSGARFQRTAAERGRTVGGFMRRRSRIVASMPLAFAVAHALAPAEARADGAAPAPAAPSDRTPAFDLPECLTPGLLAL